MIVPALAAVILVLKVIITLSVGEARIESVWWPQFVAMLIGAASLIVAQAYTTAHRPTRRLQPGADTAHDPNNIDQNAFILRDLPWSLVSAILITSALTSSIGTQLALGFEAFDAIGIGAVLGVLIYAAGWLAGYPAHGSCKDFGRWAASGLIYGGVVGLGAHLYAGLMPYAESAEYKVWMLLLPIVLGVPWALFSQLLAEIVFVGLVSYETSSDMDRLWLGRAAGWISASAAAWVAATSLSTVGGYFLILVLRRSGVGNLAGLPGLIGLGSASGIWGIVTVLFGNSKQKQSVSKEGDQGIWAVITNVILTIGGPVFAILFFIALSDALDLTLLGRALPEILSDRPIQTFSVVAWLSLGFGVAFYVAWIASRNVNINRFSMHATYRDQLIRTYLGASRQQRMPDRFTGFERNDNLPAHVLWPPRADSTGANMFCLFHVINITLNAVKSARLAWQERAVESFTVSPLHCGASSKGFRPCIEYGGGAPYGLSLGTAMTISGATASPVRGYDQSPSTKLLLALFNLRLGWWLANPGNEGNDTYTQEGPATAIRPLVEETFGLNTDANPWVFLSDGGHFENLGLYEMVRRRCRLIVAVDASCDPDFTFEDLGNAVRKIYTDFGIPITFEGLNELKNRPTHRELKLANGKIPYYAIGKIDYGAADGPDSIEGLILYIKPALHHVDSESVGVRSYAAANPSFPHQTTIDEPFTEAQFESYRLLGLNIVTNILADEAVRNRLAAALNTLAPTTRPAPSEANTAQASIPAQ